MDFLLVVSGLALLLGAGDALVRGAVSLSLRLGVPALIVSLTVVAFGTSAPELLIAVKAAVNGAPGIAMGNVVGSNVANVLLVLAGLIGLPLGAHLLIEGARSMALHWGVSEAAIGLTVVAIGTSLPELATTVTAALRRQADVALGNVIGSNIFNLVGIMGAAVLIARIEVASRFLAVDLWTMLAASVLLAPFVMGRLGLGRIVGAAFLLLYALYVALAFV